MTRRTGGIALYTHLMNWEPFEVQRSQGYAWSKTLSKDDKTGARTMLIRHDPGFKAEGFVSSWPVDIYTLEGGMRCGELTYNKDTYHYRPAGTRVGPIDCPEGVTRLIFTADSKDPSKGSTEEVFVQNVVTDLPPNPPTFRAPRSMTEKAARSTFGATETAREMFSHGHIPANPEASLQVASGQLTDRWRKILRLDPKAEIAVRVQRAFKAGSGGAREVVHLHPWIEEAFLVTGQNQDYDADIDGHWRWVPGTYVCRQPGQGLHGDATKLDDNCYMVLRTGWTSDPEKAAKWRADQDATEIPLPGPVAFEE